LSDMITNILQYIFFFFLIGAYGRKIILAAFHPDKIETKKWQIISNQGRSAYISKNLPYSVFLLISILWAYKFALFSGFWLAYFVLYFFLLLIGYISLVYSSKHEGDRIVPEMSDDQRYFNIRGRRIYAAHELIILILWIYAWQHLYAD